MYRALCASILHVRIRGEWRNVSSTNYLDYTVSDRGQFGILQTTARAWNCNVCSSYLIQSTPMWTRGNHKRKGNFINQEKDRTRRKMWRQKVDNLRFMAIICHFSQGPRSQCRRSDACANTVVVTSWIV